MTSIDFSDTPNLKTLYIQNNELTNIGMLAGVTLTYGDIRYNYLATYLRANSGLVESMNIDYLPQIEMPYSTGDDNLTQLAALMNIYNSTDGGTWTQYGNWMDTGLSYCMWYGVTCDLYNNIIDLNFSGNNLSGIVDFSGLNELHTFDIRNNIIKNIVNLDTGTLPNLQ